MKYNFLFYYDIRKIFTTDISYRIFCIIYNTKFIPCNSYNSIFKNIFRFTNFFGYYCIVFAWDVFPFNFIWNVWKNFIKKEIRIF